MKNRLTLLFASTALTVALGLPALAAITAQGNPLGFCGNDVCAALFDDADQPVPLIRVGDDDEDDDDDDGGWFRMGNDDDDDDDDDCEEGDDDDDDDCRDGGGRGNAAPAGTVAPPANGLFGNGAPPVAVTN